MAIFESTAVESGLNRRTLICRLLAITAIAAAELAVLAPGQRLDLLVQMPLAPNPSPQSYSLQAVPFAAVPPVAVGQTIATLQVIGSKATADPMPAAFNAGEPPNALYRPPIALPSQLPAPTRIFNFAFTGPKDSLSTINGLQFALPPPTQVALKLNALDVWRVTGAGAPHAFHIHINSFLMSQRNGVFILAAAIWRDTARIDPSDGTPPITTPVEFVSHQLDYTGDLVLHCHVLQHEDTSMMLSVGITA